MTNYAVHVNNQLDIALDIYTFTVPSGATTSNPETMYPVYTKVGSAAANTTSTYNPSEPLEKLAFVKQDTGMPVAEAVTNLLAESTVTITKDAPQTAQAALNFYTHYLGSPYSPQSLQFNDIILTQTDLTKQQDALNAWFKKNGMTFDYGLFSSVSYWADNDIRAWAGTSGKTFYAYSPEPPKPIIPLVLPKNLVGEIQFNINGSAQYTPVDSTGQKGTAVSLTMSKRTLSSAGATDSKGISLKLVIQDMDLHDGTSGTYEAFLNGKKDGCDFIAQPYKVPKIAWWMAAYNLANVAFTAMNLIMITHTVIALGKELPDLFESMQTAGKAVVDAVKQTANKVADAISKSFEDAGAENGDLVNVDVDVDVDIDVDVDVDIDVDVDVDVDIDVDIDVDALVVVDIDIDIDIDTDNDTDNVVDNVIDVDTDIDTDIDVDSSALTKLAKRAGSALWENKGAIFKFVLKNAAVMGGMIAAQKLLELWYKKAAISYSNEQPSAAAPLGLLLNYMENPANSVEERWTTFADYVQEGADANEQNMLVSGILSLKNAQEDKALSDWRWSSDDENQAVNKMMQYSKASDWPKAYATLASYTYKNKPLPIKVGAGVALKFIDKIL